MASVCDLEAGSPGQSNQWLDSSVSQTGDHDNQSFCCLGNRMTNSVMDNVDPPGQVVSGDWSAQELEEEMLNGEELWDPDQSDSWILLDLDILASMLRNGLDKVGKHCHAYYTKPSFWTDFLSIIHIQDHMLC